MPLYEYEHTKEPCALGEVFEVSHSISEGPLVRCPNCGRAVRRLLSRCNISAPKTNTELRDMGFTKLVRRDDGVYENVTARDGQSRTVIRDRAETYPDLRKTIGD